MNSEIYVHIADYLWNDEIASLFAFCKDEPDLVDLKTYLAARIITRSFDYLIQIRYQEWQDQFDQDDYYDNLAQEMSRYYRY